MQKISEYKVRLIGKSSMSIMLPPIWIRDNNLRDTDTLPIYRDNIDGEDVLIIKKNSNHNSVDEIKHAEPVKSN